MTLPAQPLGAKNGIVSGRGGAPTIFSIMRAMESSLSSAIGAQADQCRPCSLGELDGPGRVGYAHSVCGVPDGTIGKRLTDDRTNSNCEGDDDVMAKQGDRDRPNPRLCPSEKLDNVTGRRSTDSIRAGSKQ